MQPLFLKKKTQTIQKQTKGITFFQYSFVLISGV